MENQKEIDRLSNEIRNSNKEHPEFNTKQLEAYVKERYDTIVCLSIRQQTEDLAYN